MAAHQIGERPSASPEQFRELLAQFASGVTVATTLTESGQAVGMTATAVAAVSLEPPLLLVCVNHSDPFHEALENARMFAINILARDQQRLSQQFAGSAEARFRSVTCREGPGGLPLLDGAVAHIVCERWHRLAAGDHTVFLGRVVGGSTYDRAPLLHFRSGYTTVHGSDTP